MNCISNDQSTLYNNKIVVIKNNCFQSILDVATTRIQFNFKERQLLPSHNNRSSLIFQDLTKEIKAMVCKIFFRHQLFY